MTGEKLTMTWEGIQGDGVDMSLRGVPMESGQRGNLSGGVRPTRIASPPPTADGLAMTHKIKGDAWSPPLKRGTKGDLTKGLIRLLPARARQAGRLAMTGESQEI